jgi:hypothetical protein
MQYNRYYGQEAVTVTVTVAGCAAARVTPAVSLRGRGETPYYKYKSLSSKCYAGPSHAACLTDWQRSNKHNLKVEL